MRRTVLSVLAVLGTMAATVGPAGADTLPAMAGRPYIPSEATCFSTPGFSNRVSNPGCPNNRSWLIPLPLRWTGQTWFRASSTHPAPPAIPVLPDPVCRYVLRAPDDASVSLGNPVTITGQNILLGSPTVSSNTTTGHIDCMFPQNSSALTQVKWLSTSN
jgi:hypothetical protein